MSEEGSFGETAAEKLFGAIILLVGVVSMYYTFTSASVLGTFTGVFGFLTLVLIILGVVLLTAKVE
jgi:hypothetical protein